MSPDNRGSTVTAIRSCVLADVSVSKNYGNYGK